MNDAFVQSRFEIKDAKYGNSVATEFIGELRHVFGVRFESLRLGQIFCRQ